jgi:hypothetical protein
MTEDEPRGRRTMLVEVDDAHEMRFLVADLARHRSRVRDAAVAFDRAALSHFTS